MIFARRNQLPPRVRVNRAGGISILSFVRHLGLPDNTEFDVEVVKEEGKLVLTATEPLELETD
jgi:hypothetical protein